MTITQFFKDTLHAKLKNQVWSWGAIDSYKRVFLRVWKDEIQRDADGGKVLVYRKNPKIYSLGHNERRKHLDAMRSGAQGFGVVCTAREKPDGGRKIDDFDNRQLLRLGALSEDDLGVYAHIASRIPISELTTLIPR
jgi:hypothetical protein